MSKKNKNAKANQNTEKNMENTEATQAENTTPAENAPVSETTAAPAEGTPAETKPEETKPPKESNVVKLPFGDFRKGTILYDTVVLFTLPLEQALTFDQIVDKLVELHPGQTRERHAFCVRSRTRSLERNYGLKVGIDDQKRINVNIGEKIKLGRQASAEQVAAREAKQKARDEAKTARESKKKDKEAEKAAKKATREAEKKAKAEAAAAAKAAAASNTTPAPEASSAAE